MMLTRCEKCSARLGVRQTHIGVVVNCPVCGSRFATEPAYSTQEAIAAERSLNITLASALVVLGVLFSRMVFSQ